MPSSTPEYEVVWNGTIEVEAAKLARAGAMPKPLQRSHEDAHLLVLEFVAVHPGATMREIQFGTCLCREAVNDSLWILEKRGAITRSHYQHQDRSQPVRWTAVR